jgi:hypothetical protein
MDDNHEDQETVVSRKTPPESDPTKMDRNTPADTPAPSVTENVPEKRPKSDDSGVESINEEVPPVGGKLVSGIGR